MLSKSIRKLAEGEITSIGNILTAETTPDGEVTTFCVHGTVLLTAYHKSLGGLYELAPLDKFTKVTDCGEEFVLYETEGNYTVSCLIALLIRYFDSYKDYLPVRQWYNADEEEYVGFNVHCYAVRHDRCYFSKDLDEVLFAA